MKSVGWEITAVGWISIAICAALTFFYLVAILRPPTQQTE